MRKRLAIISALALLAGCVYLFFALFERYEKTVDTGWGPQAIRNPYLAAQQFLERAGIETQSMNSLYDAAAIGGVDTVFVEDSRNVLSERRVTLLTDWTKQGGHLIVAAHYPLDDEDSDLLLNAFNISLRHKDCTCKKEEEAGSEPDLESSPSGPNGEGGEDDEANKNADAPGSLSEALREYNRVMRGETGEAWEEYEAGVDPSELTRLDLAGASEPLHIHFDASWALQHPYFELDEAEKEQYEGIRPFYRAGTEGGTTFLQMDVGEGLVTVLATPTIWASHQIAYFDHAYLLHRLASHGDSLRMLVGSHMPSIFTLAWRHGREVIIALACWLFAWLLYRGRRFLPPVPLTVTVRRSLAEHIRAVADFLWQSRSCEVLLKPLREEIEFQAQLNLSGYGAMNQQDKCRALAKRCGAPAEAVFRAMTENHISDEDRFTKVIQLLQTIRARL